MEHVHPHQAYAPEVAQGILLDQHWSPDTWPKLSYIDYSLGRCLNHMRVPYQDSGADIAFARGLLRKHLIEHKNIKQSGKHEGHSFRVTGPVYETLVATALHFRLAKERYHMNCMSDQVLIANRVCATLQHQFDRMSCNPGLGYVTAVKNGGDEINIGLPDFLLSDKNVTKIIVEATCADVADERNTDTSFRHKLYFRNKMRNMLHLAKAAYESPNPTMDIESLLFVVPWSEGSRQYDVLTCLLEDCWREVGNGYGRGDHIDMSMFPHLSYSVLTISPGDEFNTLVRGIKHEVSIMPQESQK